MTKLIVDAELKSSAISLTDLHGRRHVPSSLHVVTTFMNLKHGSETGFIRGRIFLYSTTLSSSSGRFTLSEICKLLIWRVNGIFYCLLLLRASRGSETADSRQQKAGQNRSESLAIKYHNVFADVSTLNEVMLLVALRCKEFNCDFFSLSRPLAGSSLYGNCQNYQSKSISIY